MTIHTAEVFEFKPLGFSPQVEVAACYLEKEGRILLLQLSHDKREAGKWGVPAGKLDKGETPHQAAIRELYEETGIQIDPTSQIRALGSLYIRKLQTEFTYHLFHIQLDQIPEVRLSNEHLNYKWASDKDLTEMDLMAGATEALRYYRAQLSK